MYAVCDMLPTCEPRPGLGSGPTPRVGAQLQGLRVGRGRAEDTDLSPTSFPNMSRVSVPGFHVCATVAHSTAFPAVCTLFNDFVDLCTLPISSTRPSSSCRHAALPPTVQQPPIRRSVTLLSKVASTGTARATCPFSLVQLRDQTLLYNRTTTTALGQLKGLLSHTHRRRRQRVTQAGTREGRAGIEGSRRCRAWWKLDRPSSCSATEPTSARVPEGTDTACRAR